MGYIVTSINYNAPDYAEYEVVKGDRSYEVQIDIDENTGTATNIDIEPNPWKTDRTEATTEFNEGGVALNDPDYVMVITPIHTVDAHERTALEKMVQDLERVPAGQSRGSYRNALEGRGYRVLDSAEKNNRTQFRVAKDGREALVDVRFDDQTGGAEQVNAFPLLLDVATRQQSTQSVAHSPRPSRSGEMRKVMRELETLPLSRDGGFYRQALRQRGFQILNTASTGTQTRFEAERNGERIALEVQFDEDSGKSTNVDVASLTGTKRDSSRMSQQQESRQQDHMAQR
jgi:hypothetical protein